MKIFWAIVLLVNALGVVAGIFVANDESTGDQYGAAFAAVFLIILVALIDVGAVITGIVHYFIS